MPARRTGPWRPGTRLLPHDRRRPVRPQPEDQVVPGGFVTLNPVDGLLLRGEHLRAISDYASALARAGGMGTGTGVVYGFEVTLQEPGPTLQISPGLAISAVGAALRSSASTSVDLSSPGDLPAVGDDGFWLIEVAPRHRDFGQENIYGNLCDEPCSGSGSSLRPWTQQGVGIVLTADELPTLGTVDFSRRRNWLASQFFERERRLDDPWLVPGSSDGVASVLSRRWTGQAGEPTRQTVPIGTLQYFEGRFTLDVWTARREIGEAPGRRAWSGRLGRRAENVFLAQILQFEDQLASALPQPAGGRRTALDDPREEPIRRLLDELERTPVKDWKDFKLFKTEFASAAAPSLLLADTPSLPTLGVDELPPAGFVAVAPSDDLPGVLASFFGDGVTLRLCHARADACVRAVDLAQHLDRIPLTSAYGPPAIDILVPDQRSDLPGQRVDRYGWVAFVRNADRDCEQAPPAVDEVEVYSFLGDIDDVDGVTIPPAPGEKPPDLRRVTTVEFSAGDDTLMGKPSIWALLPNQEPVIVVCAASPAAEPLTEHRGRAVAEAVVAEGGAVTDVRPVGAFDPQIIVLVQSGRQ